MLKKVFRRILDIGQDADTIVNWWDRAKPYLGGGGGIAFARWVKAVYPSISWPLLVFVGVAGSGVVLFAGNQVARRKLLAAQASATADAATAVSTLPKTKLEVEDGLRSAAAPYAGAERECFLIRSYATFVILGLFEYFWALIYRSHLYAMRSLNSAPMEVDELREFYNVGIQTITRIFHLRHGSLSLNSGY